MKLKRSLQHVTTCKSDAQKKKNGNALVHNFVALSACATLTKRTDPRMPGLTLEV